MKRKPSEIIFILLMCAISLAGVYMYIHWHYVPVSQEIDISTPEPAGTEYPVDVINRASLEDFMSVDGIGKVKAGDIIAFREAIGGFKRAEQLKEVSGISDAIYEKLIAHFYGAEESASVPDVTTLPPETVSDVSVTSDPPAVQPTKTEPMVTETLPVSTETAYEDEEKTMKTVNINTANADEISESLIIGHELAKNIVKLREKIHSFSTVEELYLVDGMSKETYQKIKEYVTFGQ